MTRILIMILSVTLVSGSVDAGERFLFAGVTAQFEATLPSGLAERVHALSDSASKGAWREVERESEALGRKLVAAGHRDPASYSLVAAYRAAAATGLGSQAEARWYWLVALNLWPELDRGELEALLHLNPDLVSLEIPKVHEELRCEAGQVRVRNRRVDRRFLVGRSGKRDVSNFWAQGMVGKNGRFHSPRLMDTAAAMGGDAAYSGLEAMKEMKFTVPLFGGNDVECPFELRGY